MEWLERAVDAGLPAAGFARMDPLWGPYREDPDFIDLTERVATRIKEQRLIAARPWVR